MQNMKKALKAEKEKLSQESHRPLYIAQREVESFKESVKLKLRNRHLFHGDRNFCCPKCHQFIDEQKGLFDSEGCLSVKEDYETDLTILHWMCWLGTGFALIGYVLAYFRRRNDLLR